MTLLSLVQALRADESRLAMDAAERLGEMGKTALRAMPALVRASRHRHPYLRHSALLAIRRISPADERAVRACRERLNDPASFVRCAAVQSLSAAGRKNVPDIRSLLENAMSDPMSDVRAAAIGVALRSSHIARQLMPRIHQLLHDRSKHVRAEALKAIGRWQNSAPADETSVVARPAERIRKLLESKQAALRAGACEELGELPIPESDAVPLLLASLADPKPTVRAAAVHSLAEIPGAAQSATESLLRLLGDPNWMVRRAAGWALGSFAETDLKTRLRLLKMLEGREEGLRSGALHALSRHGITEEMIEPLLGAGEDKDFMERGTALHVLASSTEDLSKWTERIVKLMDDDDMEVRVAALRIVREHQLGEEGLLDSLALEGLRHDSASIRLQSVLAFEQSNNPNPDAARLLVRLMIEDPDDGVRYRAGYALHAVGGPPVEAVPQLITALKHLDESVADWATSSLGDLGPRAEAAVPALMRIAKETGASSAAASALFSIRGAEFYRSHFLRGSSLSSAPGKRRQLSTGTKPNASSIVRKVKQAIEWEIDAGIVPQSVQNMVSLEEHVELDGIVRTVLKLSGNVKFTPAAGTMQTIRAEIDQWLQVGRPRM